MESHHKVYKVTAAVTHQYSELFCRGQGVIFVLERCQLLHLLRFWKISDELFHHSHIQLLLIHLQYSSPDFITRNLYRAQQDGCKHTNITHSGKTMLLL